MKKKFLQGFLLAALVGAGVVSVTSCKDTEDDLYTELAGEQVSLAAQLNRLADQLTACKTNCQTQIDNLQTQINDRLTKTEAEATYAKLTDFNILKNQIDALLQAINALKDAGLTDEDVMQSFVDLVKQSDDIKAVAGLATNVETLNQLAAMKDQIENLINNPVEVPDLTELNNAVFGEVGDDGKRSGGLVDYILRADGNKYTVEEFRSAIESGLWLHDNRQAIESIKILYDDGLLSEAALQALKDYYAQFDEFNAMYDTLFPGVTVDSKTGKLILPEGLTEWWSYGDVIKNIIANQDAIKALKDDINSLYKRFDDLVTGLVLQATENPVFGTFNTPFGFNSMVLMTYYGNPSADVNFPAEAIEDAGLQGDVFAGLNVTSEKFGGTLYNKNLGKLYFTVNPVGANVNADGFSIENSKEVSAPVKITAEPSDAELRFGFGSRSVTNGFYEATVELDATDATDAEAKLEGIRVNIQNGMVNALKNVVKERSLTNVAGLAKVVYNNLKDVCTANALRYDWETTTGGYNEDGTAKEPAIVKNSVLSQYGLAVTAFKPLSFTTLRNQSIGYELPTFGEISIDKSLVNMNFDTFEIGDVALDVKLELDGFHVNEVGDTYVTIRIPSKFDTKQDGPKVVGYLPDGWDKDGSGYYTDVTVNIKKELNEVVAKLEEAVNVWVNGDGIDHKGIEKQLNEAIQQAVDNAFNGENGLVAKIENQVNDMTKTIQNKLNSLVDEINGDKYLGRLNNVIGRYNSLAEKINARLKNPNHYLQVAMLYETDKGGVNLVSNAAGKYTYFKYDGGDGVNLWATTYNFETLAPVYKKFVAVTKVLEDGVEKSDLIAKANNTAGGMATILDGSKKAVTLATKDVVKSGHTYAFEITYRALDYQGHTSTQRYYVVVDAK